MAELMTGWLGLLLLVVVGLLVLLGSVLRERRVGAEGSMTPGGAANSLLWLVISIGVASALITVLLRFDAVI